MNESIYCGLDLHKRFSYIVVKDSHGRHLVKGRINNNEGNLADFFAPFDQYRIKVAMEATSNYYWMYETLDTMYNMDIEVSLSHPLKTKAIASAKVKSDKIDADILSDLLRADMLPTSYIPNQRTRELREILRHRMRLVSSRTRLKNLLRDVLTKNNYLDCYADITGQKARDFISTLPLKPVFKIQCNDLLDNIDFINEKLKSVNQLITRYSKDFPEVERLTKIRGIGIFSALVLLAEIGDINRFYSPKKLVRYAGLSPGLHQTGETHYHRPITKDGNRYIRWILSEVAQHAIRYPGPLRDFYTFLARTKGKPKAIVAVARKMLTGIYFVLKNNEPFKPIRRKKSSYTYVLKNLDKPAE